MNTIDLQGTVVAKEDLRYSTGGGAIQEFTLAGLSKVITPKNIIEYTWYHRLTFLGKQAEKNMKREPGVGLRVKGALDYSQWLVDGKKRSGVNVKGLYAISFDASGKTRRDRKGQDVLVDALNQVSVIGNLVAAPKVRQTDSGRSVSNARLAVTDTWNTASGEGEKTHFVDVTFWNTVADQSAFLSKGAFVVVDGRLATDSWESGNGKRYKTYIEGSSCHLIEAKAA